MSDMTVLRTSKLKQIPQNESSTCWLACYKMLRHYVGKPATEAEIESDLRFYNINIADARATGLKAKDYSNAAAAMGFVSYPGGSYGGEFYAKLLAWAGAPIWVAGKWNPENSHNVVIVGASEDELLIVDPWWDYGTEKKCTMSNWTISQFNVGAKYYRGWSGAIQVAQK